MFSYTTSDYASGRIHSYQYLPFLKDSGIDIRIIPPSSRKSERLFKKYSQSKSRLIRVLSRFIYWYLIVFTNRIIGILKIPFYDIIYLQRGLFKYGSPALLERLAYKLSNYSIYHYDDAIYIDNPHSTSEKIKNANMILADTEELCDYAKKYNKNVLLWEDAIDLMDFPKDNFKSNKKNIVIGWVGNPNGFKYLHSIKNPIKRILNKYDNVTLRIVSNKEFKFDKEAVTIDNQKWSAEYNQVRDFDIGIMPLLGDNYDKAKGGYKLLEYMAARIPYVCSQTADNFLENGVTGFIVNNDSDWFDKLSTLIEDENIRRKMGFEGRKLIEKRFDLNLKGPQLSYIIRDVISDKKSNKI